MPRLEVERKRQLPKGSFSSIEKLLINHGYSLAATLEESDYYFSRRDIDYMKTVECLRVRSRPGFAEITYKPASTSSTVSHDNIISKKELNVELANESNAPLAIELLETIGLLPLTTVHKFRRTYKRDANPDETITIDTIAKVGDFIEIEVMSRDKSGASEILRTTENMLGLETFPIVTKPYRDLVMEAS